MTKIFKFPLSLQDYQEVELPFDSQILSCAYEGKQLCMWAIVNEESSFRKTLKVEILGTNIPINPEINRKFVQTVISPSGNTLHIFRIVK